MFGVVGQGRTLRLREILEASAVHFTVLGYGRMRVFDTEEDERRSEEVKRGVGVRYGTGKQF